MKGHPFLIFSKAFFVSLCLFTPGGLCEELKIVAIVNHEVITEAELDQAMAPLYLQLQATLGPEEVAQRLKEIKGKVLEQLIEEKLMLQEARDPKPVEVAKGKIGTPIPIEATEAEVEEVVHSATARFQDPEEFVQALTEQGLSLEDLKSRYRNQIVVQKLIAREIYSRVSLSPAEVTAYYESHRQEFLSPPAVQTALILIRPKGAPDTSRARNLALDLRRRIDQGADFYDLATRYSDGPNAKMGGRLGFLEKGKSLKEIDSVLFGLKVGEVSPVITTPAGFHLFRIESIRPGAQAELHEVQAQIQERLFQEKAAARYKEWIEKLKSHSYIVLK